MPLADILAGALLIDPARRAEIIQRIWGRSAVLAMFRRRSSPEDKVIFNDLDPTET